ncbi:maltokinase N-terminal cap-like domain-containing protein [Amycolatopsis jiangsuensis]|uniref:Maltokinase n=1 Tax=Amycolatopsis jiangsuensis TaxID=1181879 RepID=A0A840IMF7_9PSEU|nr:maltokinase [Amycolatopsis jiangsuensis]
MTEHGLPDGLAGPLAAWLPGQRWFAGKDRPIDAVRPHEPTVLVEGDPLLLHVVVDVVQGDRTEAYQLLLGRRSQPPEVPSTAWLGEDTGLYEASGDADLTAMLLEAIASGTRIGAVTFEPEPGETLTAGLRARPITAEQSNTSLVYGGQYILKLFRKLSPGTNKDLLLHRALQSAGCAHVARVVGSITGELAGKPATIGMLQEYLPDAVDGWAMATTSVRDLLADADRHPDEAGGDFAGEAERLGAAVAEVHADLAGALGTTPVDRDELDRTVRAMNERLDRVAATVPQLVPHVPALRAAFEAVRSAQLPPVSMQYVHGDLHLGQVLRTVGGWLLLDFEGEPAAPVHERHALRSPLRDVAGMLRSFDYAAQQLLVGAVEQEPEQVARALEWARRNRAAFRTGYAGAEGPVGDPLAHATLLRAFELDKAVYEVAYEHANRPDWLAVPLAAIARSTDGGE